MSSKKVKAYECPKCGTPHIKDKVFKGKKYGDRDGESHHFELNEKTINPIQNYTCGNCDITMLGSELIRLNAIKPIGPNEEED